MAVIIACFVLGLLSRAQAQFGTGLDLRDDSHHRINAGLFLPESEPILIQAYDDRGKRVRGGYVRAQSELGRLFIWKDAFEELPLYLFEGAFDTHVEVAVPRSWNIALVFAQEPRHPFDKQEHSEGAGRKSGGAPMRSEAIELPCDVSALFCEPGAQVSVTVVTDAREPLPFALLRFERQHFGAMAVQCDAGGSVRLSADDVFVASGAVVKAVTIERGTILGRRRIADVMRLAGGARLVVSRVD